MTGAGGTDGEPTWEELRTRFTGVRDTTLHAHIRWDDGDAPDLMFFNGSYPWGPGLQATVADDGRRRPVDLELWSDGRKVRVEKDGQPYYISNGDQAWFFRDDPARPDVVFRASMSHGRAMDYSGEAQWLVHPVPAFRWIDEDVQPEGSVEEYVLGGRTAWTFVVSGIRAWIDQESLHVLALQFDGSTYRERLVSPEIGEPVDDSLFTWTGPVVTPWERRQADQEKEDRKKQEKAERSRQWFVDTAAAEESELRSVPVTLDLTPTAVPVYREDTGEFRAYGDNVTLSRHLPDTELQYEDNRYAHRWTAQGYIWQLNVGPELCLGRKGIEEVWDQLHPGEPVTDYRPAEEDNW